MRGVTTAWPGKTPAPARARAGKQVFDKQLANTGLKVRNVFEKLTPESGTVLVVADQPASIGAPPVHGRPGQRLQSRLPVRLVRAADRRLSPARRKTTRRTPL